MRGFIILCLTSLAVAAPQGYNYVGTQQQPQPQQPHAQYGPAPSFFKDLQSVMDVQTLVNNENNFASSYPSASGIEQYSGTTGTGVSGAASFAPQPQPHYLAPAVAAANVQKSASIYEHHHTAPVEALVSKRFFIHSAPDEEEEEVHHKTLTVGTSRKNYNVVFIKAPAKAPQKTAIKILPAVNEDKTVIYVLAKKTEAAEIDAQVHEPITTTAKPEVYFIKYKTNEEAAHAQHTIQAQYDSLGGSTHISNEGISPVSSVIGTLDALKHASAAAEIEHETQFGAPLVNQPQEVAALSQSYQSPAQYAQTNSGYLPPSNYFHKQ